MSNEQYGKDLDELLASLQSDSLEAFEATIQRQIAESIARGETIAPPTFKENCSWFYSNMGGHSTKGRIIFLKRRAELSALKAA